MNKSFSKIRHIQESNSRLEKRLLGEQTEDLQDDKLQEIIDMDNELDNDPTYKKYEKVYMGNRLKSMLQDQMGLDLDDMSEEEAEALIGMFSSMVDISKAGERPKMTRDTIINRKDSVMDIVNQILEMAIEDDEYELASKLRDYNKLLQDYN
jgi:hypothetical protein